MYTKYSFKLFHFSFFLPFIIGASSIYFNPKNVQFYTTTSSKRRLILVTLLFLLLTGFFWTRTLTILDKATSSSFHLCYAFSTAVTVETCYLSYLNWKQDDLASFATLVTRHFIRFQRQWMRNYNPMRSLSGIGLDAIIALQTIFFAGLPLLMVLHYLLFPQTPIYVTTLLSSDWSQKLWVYLGYAGLVTYYNYVLWQSVLVVSGIALLYLCSVLPLIHCELRIGGANQKSLRSLRSGWKLPVEYRAVELLHKLCLEIYGDPILVLQGIFGQFILFCNVSVIKYRTILAIPTTIVLIIWSLVISCIWLLVLELSGRFREEAKKTIASWRAMSTVSNKERKYMAKFKKGCRPLKIGTGGLFTIRRLSVLKFMRAIVKGMMKALVLGK